MKMEQTKSIFSSKTVWGGVLVVVAAIAGMFGYTISADDQASLAGTIENIVLAVGGLLAIWGRITATKRIG
jgi:protein-S-isoprenylcysteine O-methyltransferase Ste14